MYSLTLVHNLSRFTLSTLLEKTRGYIEIDLEIEVDIDQTYCCVVYLSVKND